MKKSFFFYFLILIGNCTNAQSVDSAQVYFKKATDEKAARHYLVASAYFDKAIQFNPKFTEAYIENGNTNLEMRKVDAAMANFTMANQLDPANTDAIKELTSLYFNNRQFQKAIDMAQKCKDCADAEKIVAISNYNLEDYGQAVTGLQKALLKSPNDVEILYTLGRSYIELEDYKKAIASYEKAVAIDPSKSTWLYELGLLYYNQDQFKDALNYFIKAADAGYTKSNDFLENIGFAYLYTNDIDNGLKNISVVLSRKPNNVELLTDVAQAMYTIQKYDDALTYYQKLMELNPRDAKTLYMAGMAFQKKGDKQKGQAMCDKAIQMDPSLAEKRQKQGGQFGL